MKICAAILMALPFAAPAFAQETSADVKTPSDVISFLVTNPPAGVRTEDFQKDQDAAAKTRDTITRALLVNLVTVPIATSSSGFVYRLDPELGTMARVSDSFGTFFVERAMTSGKGRTSFGMSGTTAAYDRLDGLNLRDGTLVTTANQFDDENAPFDRELLTLKIRTSTLTLFGSYGITDRLEVGGAVPLVQLHIEGSSVNVYRGDSVPQVSAIADASGVADVALRTKYTLVSVPGGGFAAGAEVRLPTGDQASLLGAGRAALRFLALGSVEHAHVGVHGNFAIVRGGISDELDGSGAVTIALTPRVTATGEFLLRRFSDLHTIDTVSRPHPTFFSHDADGNPVGVQTFRLSSGTESSIVSTLVSGVKWNVRAAMVLTGQVQWRMGNGGLTAPVTPTISLDYLF
jgi:hypothetical protein